MFPTKLVVVDTKQGGNMTYLHVYNQVGCSGHETGGNMTYLHVFNQVG